MNPEILRKLESRLGVKEARARLKFEADHEAQIFGQGLTFFHLENWYSARSIIRKALKATGLYWHARRIADRVVVRRNALAFQNLPSAFHEFTILHISDLHVDLSEGAMRHLLEIVGTLRFDVCALTGDYRGQTYGPIETAMEGVERLRAEIKKPTYAVFGNHDSVRMVPRLEAMDIRVLLNECETLARGDQRIHLAGIEDAHFYRAEDIGRAASNIPKADFAIVLSHTPEVYRQAAEAGFALMLSGHTHGGQLCLPGGIPIKLEAVLPRRMGAGAWKYRGMNGYTSVGVGTSILPVRLNCPPEITLHVLRRG
ncbi:MAG TPA: metallophosphoesterase [Terriglobales bacterium]